jgi:hypothetical protein
LTHISEFLTPQSLAVSENIFFPDLTQSRTKHILAMDDSKRQMEYEKMNSMVENYVKTELFHVLKFVSSPSLIQFSSAPKSLCQVVCKKFNVYQHNQETFWMMYSNLIEKKLNQKRSDISNLMKKAFKDMYKHYLSVSWKTILINYNFFTDLSERERIVEENSGFYIPVSIVDSDLENSANYVDFATLFSTCCWKETL